MKRIFDNFTFWGTLFLITYFFLYIFPFPLEWLPFKVGESISSYVDKFWQWLVLLLVKDGFGYHGDIATRVNGSGDTSYHSFKLLVQGAISAIVATIWLILDRAKDFFGKIKKFTAVYIRYYLAFTMLTYGLAKVFPNQFWEPGLTDMLRPFGEISPMGLLWKFMGYSVPYIIFTGVMEVMAGVLLFFRKTTRLGAILAFGIMLNVFVLNMSYDVPVKLFSFHLVLLSIIILSKDITGLLNFFVLNKPVPADKIEPYFKNERYVKLGFLVKGFIILFITSVMVVNNYSNQWKYGRKAKMPSLYGIYNVETFVVNNDTIEPLLTDENRWRRFIVDRYSSNITKMNGDILYAESVVDTINTTIQIKPFKESSTFNFQYELRDSVLVFNGTKGKDSIRIDFKIKDKNEFYLMKRGFHWINEFPNNR